MSDPTSSNNPDPSGADQGGADQGGADQGYSENPDPGQLQPPGPVQMPTSPPEAPKTVIINSPIVPPPPPGTPGLSGAPVVPPPPPGTYSTPPATPPPASPSFGAPHDAAAQQAAPSWVGPDNAPLATAPQAAPSSGGSGRLAWVAAAIGALVLLGGGAFFAVRALGQDAGSDSPEAAVTEMFEALSNEDFVTIATLVEPDERRTLVEPTFEILEELQRLGVLADDLDTASVEGVDFEFNDVEFRTEQVTDDLYQAYIEGGESVSSFDVSELPLGELILERLDADDLASAGSETGLIESSDVPIALVERDGRWYWSLWYTVGEAARTGDGRAFPAGRTTLLPAGAETPEGVVDVLFERLFAFDLEGLVALIDPDEGAALYDYSPLFLPDAVSALADIRSEAEAEGISWQIESIDSAAAVDGDVGEATLSSMRASITGPDVEVALNFAIDADDGTTQFSLNGTLGEDRIDASWSVDADGCTVVQSDIPGSEVDESICPGDVLDTQEQELLDAFQLGSDAETGGLAIRRVDGRWYMSPTSTVMNSMLGFLQSVERDELERSIDAFAEFADDPFALGEEMFGGTGSATLIEPIDPTEDFSFGSTDGTLARQIPLDRDGDGNAFAEGSLQQGFYDEYALALDVGESVAIVQRSNDFDSFLTIVDGTEAVIASNDDFDNLDSGVDVTGPGTVFIRVAALDNIGSGNYTLEVLRGQSVADLATFSGFEESTATVGTITTIDWQTQAVELSDSVAESMSNQYELNLQAGEQVTVTLRAADDTFDPYLEVMLGGQLVARNDDFDGLNSGLEFVADAAGTYVIDARDFTLSPGGYILTIEPGFTLGG